MDRTAIKSKPPGAVATAVNQYSSQFIGGIASFSGSRIPGNGTQSGAKKHEASGSTADTFRMTAKESESFLHIVEATAKINSHYELYLLLQSAVQYFIPHQILISAWGDFQGSKPNLDVISSLEGVRTGQLNGCGCTVEHLLKDLFTRWVDGGRQPFLLNETDSVVSSACGCALHSAMRRMRSVLVHGIRNERDDLDSLYVTLNTVSIKNGQSPERFFFLVDTLIAQIDVAFRKVAALKSSDSTAHETAARGPDNLSAREQEIVKWITEGKTNTEIAEILSISSFTVKNHTQRIFRKLGATNRTQAVAKYRHENSAAR